MPHTSVSHSTLYCCKLSSFTLMPLLDQIPTLPLLWFFLQNPVQETKSRRETRFTISSRPQSLHQVNKTYVKVKVNRQHIKLLLWQPLYIPHHHTCSRHLTRLVNWLIWTFIFPLIRSCLVTRSSYMLRTNRVRSSPVQCFCNAARNSKSFSRISCSRPCHYVPLIEKIGLSMFWLTKLRDPLCGLYFERLRQF